VANRTAEQLAEKLVLYADSVPQRLKPELILWNLTARLEATPFQNGLQNRIFPQAVKRCATHGL